MRLSAASRASLVFLALGLLGLGFADLEITTAHPWAELARLLRGLVTPALGTLGSTPGNTLGDVGLALAQTVAFALAGVSLAAVAGFLLAPVYEATPVRVACASGRAVHELFWALIFLQMFGFHPLTGILAIAVPYTGIFARVYAEIIEQADRTPLNVLPRGTSAAAAFAFARVPGVWVHIETYTRYRFECGLRSSAVLGFIGLPTLGYYLHSAFMEGYYSDVGALLLLFYLLIGTVHWWMRARLLPVYALGAWLVLPGGGVPGLGNLVRFLSVDIVPAPLRAGGDPAALGAWLETVLWDQAVPGAWSTVVLTQIALVATGVVALAVFPLVSRPLLGRLGRRLGHVVLVVARSTPEYMLAFMLLQLWGPSMLPAIVALAIHNGAIVGHLVGQYTNSLTLRADRPLRRLDRYGYEVLPRAYGTFLALTLYRWEIIMRETAILGMLGVATLGFYVDSAIQDIRFDRAAVLIAITAALNVALDLIARRVRRGLGLRSVIES